MQVEIHSSEGKVGSGELANLTISSVFVRTSVAPRFREAVTILGAQLELSGSVALVCQEPRGFVLTFGPSIDSRKKVSELQDSVPVVGDRPRRPSHSLLPPIPVPRVRVSSDAGRTSASATSNEPEPAIGGMNPPAGAIASLNEPEPVIGGMNPPAGAIASLNASQSESQATKALPPGRFPELRLDGTLRFESSADFCDQYRLNIVHGGILARSSPLSVGSTRTVRLIIPGVQTLVELRLRVGFVGEGTVGFMIDSFALERSRLEAVLSEANHLA